MKRSVGSREVRLPAPSITSTAPTKENLQEHDDGRRSIHGATHSSTPPATVVEYDVLYYKSTRKVHKSKGVSKSDGILSIDKSTGKVVLYGERDDDNNETTNDNRATAPSSSPQQHPVVLYSGLNSALYRRCDDLLTDENLRMGAYEVDVVSARSMQKKTSVTTQAKPAAPGTTSSLSSKSVVTTGLRRPVLLPVKRPLGSITTSTNRLVMSRTSAPPARASTSTTDRPEPSSESMSTGATTDATAAPAVTKPLPPKRTVVRQPLQSTASARAAVTAAATKTGTKSASMSSLKSIRPTSGSKTRVPPPSSQGTSHVLHRTSTTTSSSSVNANAAAVGASTSVKCINDDQDGSADVLQRMPVKVASVLRPHQVVAVQFLWNALHKPGGGAILADEPGLGKTLTTIACISALHRANRSKHFCVVCPSSLVNNWVKEFDHWLGKQGQPKRVPLLKGDTTFNSSSMKSFLHSKVGQVVIMSYDLFRLHSHHFAQPPAAANQNQLQTQQPQAHGQQERFALLVVDEGHRLKSTAGSQTLSSLELLPADARLLLSATPIQNNLGELFTLANFCRPGILGHDIAEFRRRFEKPISSSTSAATGHGAKHAAQRELDQILSTFMLRRLQSDVLKSMLPPRMEVLIFCRPSHRQCELYQDIVAAATSNATSVDVLSALTSLRKVCSHPFLYDRAAMAAHSSGSQKSSDQVQLSGKLLVLQGLLRSMLSRSGEASSSATLPDKVVIVSNFTSTLTLVESLLLKPAGYTYVRLDGSTSPESRQSLVEAFNKQSKLSCFLLSSKAGGCGLNLIGANRLILLDPSWNPADDIQAMGRIYRQGQQRSTSIYRLFTSGTIEEVMYQRQTSKNALSNGVLDKKGGPGFSRDEINDCMNLKVGCDCDTRRKATGTSWPPYSGPASLLEQNVFDVPLTDVATTVGRAIGFVRIVPDLGSDDSGTSAEAAWEGSGSATASTDLYDSNQEEECEFDHPDRNADKPWAAASSSESESEFQ